MIPINEAVLCVQALKKGMKTFTQICLTSTVLISHTHISKYLNSF